MKKYTSYAYYLIPLIIFLVTLIFLYYGLDRGDPRYVPSPLINKPIPILNKKLFLGHVSLLNIWASWCESCKEEHKVLENIAKNNKSITIYGLNYKDNPKQAKNWLKQAGNPYRKVFFDETGEMGINLGVYGTPETYVIDKLGIIRYKYIGPINQEIWTGIILPEINKIK